MTKSRGQTLKKYWSLMVLPVFVLGWAIVRVITPKTCGCGGGWIPLPNPILYPAPMPLWLVLISGFTFCALFITWYMSINNKAIKWGAVIVFTLFYIGCICYSYFILPMTCVWEC